MKIRIKLRDRSGSLVEEQVLPPEEAVALAGRFILLQGSDPDYQGRGATDGSVYFQPVREAGDRPFGPVGADE